MEVHTYYTFSYGILGALTLPIIMLTSFFLAVKAVLSLLFKPPVPPEKMTVKVLKSMVCSAESSKRDVQWAAKSFISLFSRIPARDSQPNIMEAQEKLEFVRCLSENAKVDEQYITSFEKDVIERNPSYKGDIAQIVARALNNR